MRARRGWTLLVLGGSHRSAASLYVPRWALALTLAAASIALSGGGAWAGWRAREVLAPLHQRHVRSARARTGRRSAVPQAPAAPSGSSDEPPPSPALREARARFTPTGLKVLIVGIDGAAHRVLERLMDEGKLPTFEALRERGTSTVLRSIPPMRSPSLWTSMVTGRTRHEHGIVGFLNHEGPSGQLVSVADRRANTLWNMLSGFGLDSGVIGWWVTWPAERVKGYVVTDRAVRSRWTEWSGGSPVAARTYPAGLMRELEPLVVDPASPPMDEIDALADFDPSERRQFLDATRPVLAHGPSVFKFAHCAQRSYERIAEHMLQSRQQPALTAVFLGATDAVSHTFWHDFEPGRFAGVDREQAGRLGALIPNYYRHDDQALGKLLSLVDDSTVVLVVSDHGFRPSGELPRVRRLTNEALGAPPPDAAHVHESEDVEIGQTGQHHPDGVLVAAGGPIRHAADIRADIYDIAPTVLALLGLPVADDMAGHVLRDLVDEGFWQAHPIQTIPSYEDLLPASSGAHDGADDPILMEQLQALGYVSAS